MTAGASGLLGRTGAPGAALSDSRVRGFFAGLAFGSIVPIAALWRFVDRPAADWAASADRPWSRWVSNLGLAETWLVPAAVAFVVLAIRRRHNAARWAFLLIAAVASSGILVNLVKPIFARARPLWESADSGISYSFPSGHAVTISSAATILLLWKPRWWPLWVGMALAVAAARVASRNHYPSDALAGLIFGAFVALLCEWVWAKWRPASRPVRIAAAMPAALICMAISIAPLSCASDPSSAGSTSSAGSSGGSKSSSTGGSSGTPSPSPSAKGPPTVEAARSGAAAARSHLAGDLDATFAGLQIPWKASDASTWSAAQAKLGAIDPAKATGLQKSVATVAAPKLEKDLAAARGAANDLTAALKGVLAGQAQPEGEVTLSQLTSLKQEAEQLVDLVKFGDQALLALKPLSQ